MFLQLIIDPVCSIVFESEPDDADTMHRPPRAADASIFGVASVMVGLIQGTVLLLSVLVVDWVATVRGLDADGTRALTFTTLALGAVALVFANRSLSPGIRRILFARNLALWPIAFGTCAILVVVLMVPQLRNAFHFGVLDLENLLVAFLAVVVSAVAFGLSKRIVVAPRRELRA
jgi:Ca2+-transporting ATPase